MKPQRLGEEWQFKLWQEGDTFAVRLAGVTQTSAQLGPDFTVHYFNCGESRWVSIYHGFHPQEEDGPPLGTFRSVFDGRSAEWALYKGEGGFKAVAQVSAAKSAGEDTWLWQVTVEAETEEAAREMVTELRTFKQVRGQKAAGAN